MHAKIEKLLRLTGTPPDKRALAVANYERLLASDGEPALDARIKDIETAAAEVRAWRSARTPS